MKDTTGVTVSMNLDAPEKYPLDLREKNNLRSMIIKLCMDQISLSIKNTEANIYKWVLRKPNKACEEYEFNIESLQCTFMAAAALSKYIIVASLIRQRNKPNSDHS
jgi:hypothetical protein